MKPFLQKVSNYLLRFLQIQLFLSLVSLPILIWWGLPFSYMTALGNLVFGPFLTVFLFCSSLIFFTELLFIPNGWLIIFLEKVTKLWLFCLGFGKQTWLIGFHKPSLFFLVLSTCTAFLIMQHKKLNRLIPSICCLALLFCCTTGYLALTQPKETEFFLVCGKKKVSITVSPNAINVTDNGAFSSKLSSSSWVQYTLLPEIIKQTGRTVIDSVAVKRINTLSLEALSTLCEQTTIKTITLPYFSHTLTKAGWRAFFRLQRIAQKTGCNILRF